MTKFLQSSQRFPQGVIPGSCCLCLGDTVESLCASHRLLSVDNRVKLSRVDSGIRMCICSPAFCSIWSGSVFGGKTHLQPDKQPLQWKVVYAKPSIVGTRLHIYLYFLKRPLNTHSLPSLFPSGPISLCLANWDCISCQLHTWLCTVTLPWWEWSFQMEYNFIESLQCIEYSLWAVGDLFMKAFFCMRENFFFFIQFNF